MQYEPIIGLEIHVELKTKSKMFCGCKNDPFHAPKPNIYTCPVCLGLPGALPVPNRTAVEWCMMLGLALNCQIPQFTKFDRKNYFYPDLSKGYQISQYDKPIAVDGYLKSTVNEVEKTVRIRRVHMEEDTGKLLHSTVDGKQVTLVDFNRSGVPLVEIVTEPDIRSSEEARVFLKKLHQIIRYLGISDADMEKGSMRLEPNISVREVTSSHFAKASRDKQNSKVSDEHSAQRTAQNDEELPAYKVEVKNINSFSFAKKAIDFEIARHIEILEQGQTPKQETRGWDEKRVVTVGQRSKEEAADYRYFPDPDIPPIVWTEQYIHKIGTQVPELPDNKKSRYINTFGLSAYDATVLTDEKQRADYFESAIANSAVATGKIDKKTLANWIINKKIDSETVSPEELVKKIADQSNKTLLSDEELKKIITTVIENNPKPVADYCAGKEGTIMYLIGLVMREAKGKADATMVRKHLIELLQN